MNIEYSHEPDLCDWEDAKATIRELIAGFGYADILRAVKDNQPENGSYPDPSTYADPKSYRQAHGMEDWAEIEF